MALGPLLTALGARLVLGQRLAARTWGAIALAGVGIAWMYGHAVQAGDARQVLGTAVALCVPVAVAVNWTLLQHLKSQSRPPDMLGAVQLAIPCLMAVAAARVLSAPEIALLGLLEVVFGVLWAWLGANEAPSTTVLGGGALVLLALTGNEMLALRRRAQRTLGDTPEPEPPGRGLASVSPQRPRCAADAGNNAHEATVWPGRHLFVS